MNNLFDIKGNVTVITGGTIHYLMSDASKFVTGTVAVVDGGFNVFAM